MSAAAPLDSVLDLLVVGAGPTGIGLGAEARKAGLTTLLVDRGPLVASLVDYPNEMLFFTTRDRLEVAGVKFAIPDDKPNRRQAIVYYRAVVETFGVPLALHEDVLEIRKEGELFVVSSQGRGGAVERRARAVAVATGYFCNPTRLDVPGEDLPWVHHRYREPYAHFGESVVVVGGGNAGAETALELFRHGAHVTIVHRHPELKATIKYWVKPDLENRIAEGSIRALLAAQPVAFEDGGVRCRSTVGEVFLPAEAAYILIGYAPETEILERVGVTIDPASGAPDFDAESCETGVSGLYVAGTVQAGRETHRIFIENSREHCVRIVEHLKARLRGTPIAAGI
ncbi:MAG: NAD(P)-binding domain-containing protein [Thermoanaerobaculia bacterium]